MNFMGTSPEGLSSEKLIESDVQSTPSGGGTPILLEYLRVIERRRWLIGAILVASVAIAVIVTLLMTPQYTAKTRVEISRQEQRITNIEGVSGKDATFDQEFYETQYALLKTRAVAERVARSLGLARDPAFFEAHGVRLDDEGGRSGVLSKDSLKEREDQAVALLQDHVAIQPLARSALVDIMYESANPTLSANIANSWGREFIAESLDRRFASTASARRFLEQRLETLRERVQQSERELVKYANRSGIVVLEQKSEDGRVQTTRTLTSANLQAMNAALAEATAARIAAQARAAAADVQPAGANQTVSSLRQRKAESEAALAQMLVQFEPAYPPARALRQQIASLNTAIAREEGRGAQALQKDYQAALRREQDLQHRVGALTQALTREERARIQYNIYQREADTNRQLYDSLLQRYKEIGVAGVAASNISVVDEARVPTSPSKPKLPLNMAVALLVGIALAGLVVFILEQFDEGVRYPSDVQRALGLPLLGAVPDIGDENPQELIQNVKSELTEAYLTVNSSLAFSTDHGVPKSLVVVSTRPAEGKSTSSVSIATVLARTGKRVVLIDADMRSPSLHTLFDVKQQPGFSNYLAGEENWKALMVPTSTPGLNLIPAGITPPNPAELLTSDRVVRLVAAVEAEFDHVVIDSPPLLGLADAPLLARAADGVVYVAEASGVPVRGIKAAVERLRTSRSRIVGVILTKLKQSGATEYGYGVAYGYGLAYGGADKASNA
ncbi:polysaccharide biosynthesis tyrosine autokinase [Sphingomonas sp. MAH-20]|uniref:non-specific protein-tyrosine kinase n=1 Tax=Sphingomonas horti TaxID=2682842 RepID=A0A6I4J3Z8_9SPHN|nr:MULTISPECIES: polysaccharide biosynthesis tyrosine autokinase [Sphingomonas]MBA2919780.1 polysaccharide biosynthesis tyrosine autokinase [Sphingomonas sp. CGMCC 1.13658]MVO78021.1 polysaccharide biosynthesis tyrosine autokinase [Sphingomonas horti]